MSPALSCIGREFRQVSIFKEFAMRGSTVLCLDVNAPLRICVRLYNYEMIIILYILFALMSAALPVTEFQTNPLTALVLTKRGGHFGFLEGLLPTGGTWMNRALRQCLTALHHHNLHGAQLD